MVGQSFAATRAQTSFRWSWAIPLLPIAAAMFSLSALVYYHTAMGGQGEAWGFFQGLVLGLYRWLGFVPAFMFWLLVFAWCSIWFITGRLDRPLQRLLWLSAFTLSVAILVNIGADGVAPPAHAGIVGTYLATRLTSVLGYAVSALMAVGAALAALLLATDFLFYRYFEALGRIGQPGLATEKGVEPEATDAFRELAQAADELAPSVPGRPRIVLDDRDLPDAELVDSDDVRVSDLVPDIVVGVDDEELVAPGSEPDDDVASEDERAAVMADTEDEYELAVEADDRDDEYELAAVEAEAGGEDEPGEQRPPVLEADEPQPGDDADEADIVAEPVVEIPRPARQPQLFEDAAAGDPERLEQAAELVFDAGRASASILRRRLGCSHGEAIDLLDGLRDAGVIDGAHGDAHGRVRMAASEWRHGRGDA